MNAVIYTEDLDLPYDVSEATHDDMVAWSFAILSNKDPWMEDKSALLQARSKLSQSIQTMNISFATKKSAFEADTVEQMSPRDFRARRYEYVNWKRNAGVVLKKLESRISTVNARLKHINQREHAPKLGTDERARLTEKIDDLETHVKDLGVLLGESIDLLKDLVEDEECSYDHHGDCQTHGWFGLDNEKCPNELAKQFVDEIGEHGTDDK